MLGTRSHDVSNLFAGDGSLFWDEWSSRPTPTVGSLELRCADGIQRRGGEWT